MGDMMGMGAGLGMGQQMASAFGNNQNQQSSQSASAPHAAPPPPPPSSSALFVSIDGQSAGPFETAKLKEMILKGELNRDSFVWRQGFDGWKKAEDIIADLFDQMPPPMPS